MSSRRILHWLFALCALAGVDALAQVQPAYVQFNAVTYTQGVSGPLLADIYAPRTGDAHPAVLEIHGGGWRSGDRTQTVKLSADLATLGYVVMSIDYDLVPVHFPVALRECETALDYLRAHAKTYNVDPNRIAVLGSSAGGELAALLAFAETGTPHPVQGAVVLNGVLDLAALGDGSGMVTDYLGARCSVNRDTCEQASPQDQVRAGAPPFFVGHGTDDTTVPFTQFERFVDRLREQHIPVTTFIAPKGKHTYWMAPEFYRANLAELAAFLQKTLAATSK